MRVPTDCRRPARESGAVFAILIPRPVTCCI